MRVKLPSLTSGSERVPRRGRGWIVPPIEGGMPNGQRGSHMQLAVPNVVAIAVRTVITMLRILPQVLLLLNVPIVVI